MLQGLGTAITCLTVITIAVVGIACAMANIGAILAVWGLCKPAGQLPRRHDASGAQESDFTASGP